MLKTTSIRTLISLIISFNTMNQIDAQIDESPNRSIEIAGLVLDHDSLGPLSNVSIYGSDSKLLATSDNNGYFNLKIPIFQDDEEIRFTLSFNKENYETYIQNEHWGNLSGDIKSLLYVMMQKSGQKEMNFTELISNVQHLSYDNTLIEFTAVKERIVFGKKLRDVKIGNQKVFFEINDGYYLINDSGWIKINGKDDLISINGEFNIPAFKINSYINRNEVKGMTPLEGAKILYRINTY